MADDRTGGSRRSWRSKGAPAGRADKQAPGHEWARRGSRPKGTAGPPRAASLKVVGAALGFFGLLAALVILIIMLRRPPLAAVVLVGAQYADNPLVPPNVLGWRGLAGIAEVSRAEGSRSLLP